MLKVKVVYLFYLCQGTNYYFDVENGNDTQRFSYLQSDLKLFI